MRGRALLREADSALISWDEIPEAPLHSPECSRTSSQGSTVWANDSGGNLASTASDSANDFSRRATTDALSGYFAGSSSSHFTFSPRPFLAAYTLPEATWTRTVPKLRISGLSL